MSDEHTHENGRPMGLFGDGTYCERAGDLWDMQLTMEGWDAAAIHNQVAQMIPADWRGGDATRPRRSG